MVQNSTFTPIPRTHRVAELQVILGLILVSFGAVSAILSSKFGLGLLSVWPVFVLFFVFTLNYELGLICFVLSFAYQAPVVFAPEYGFAAVVRLDELVFASVFPVWFLRNCVRGSTRISLAPLTKPLLFYVLIAFLSLIPRCGAIGSTPFLYSATGFKGLGPLIFKLAEVVLGYIILTDSKITQRTRTNLFYCLPIVAFFAVTLSFLVSHGILPKDIVAGRFYDLYLTVKFSLYGNTSAWGVFLASYFFILLCSIFYFDSSLLKIILLFFLFFCIEGIFISGAKTAIVAVGLGLIFLAFKQRRRFARLVKIAVLTFVLIIVGIWSLNRFATYKQKQVAYSGLKRAYTSIYAGIKGSGGVFYETALGKRVACWFQFGEAIEEEPELLLLGRGWHRRAVYETGIGLHNDFLTACHDLGVLGVVFVAWIYLAMYRQFSFKKERFVLPEKANLLRLTMQSLVIVFIASSFTTENLTFYGGGIDVQFPFMVMVMGVTWGYLKTLNYRVA